IGCASNDGPSASMAISELEFIESVEIPTQRSLRAVNFNDVFRARSDSNTTGLEHADSPRFEASQNGCVVLVFHLALWRRINTLGKVASSTTGRQWSLLNKDAISRSHSIHFAHDKLCQVESMGHQVSQDSGASKFLFKAPGQSTQWI